MCAGVNVIVGCVCVVVYPMEYVLCGYCMCCVYVVYVCCAWGVWLVACVRA